jgi:membrane-bound lytic murein transglycosylase D
MKTICAAFLCLAIVHSAPAQDELLPADLLQQAGEWVNENIDDSVLDALGVDEDRTRQFLAELQKQFEGPYVYDLGALRDTATQLVPILQKYEETQPYAAWLRSRLDYFEVSEKLHRAAAPKATNTLRLPAPSPQMERTVWVKVLEQRPVPPAARPHLARLKAIFIEEKVPPELVWIAEVESSFDARARSPAGAAGLFQLMPVTARSLDLSVNFLQDERLQPEKNARAAARYLRQLHGRFGDWRLAFAAYNAGETRVAALLKKHKARTFDEIAAHLPSETQLYVPKIEATLRKREGVTLADLKTGRG